MHIIQLLGYLAFSWMIIILHLFQGKQGSKIILSALTTFFSQSNLWGSNVFFFFFQQITRDPGTYKPELWHRLAFLLRVLTSPHCPCCQCRGLRSYVASCSRHLTWHSTAVLVSVHLPLLLHRQDTPTEQRRRTTQVDWYLKSLPLR